VALIELPPTGQPIKLYVYHAALGDRPIGEVLPYVVLNRLGRLAVSGLTAALFGWLFRSWTTRHARLTRWAYVGTWAAIYSTYWARRSG
jgi:hypothetical protein